MSVQNMNRDINELTPAAKQACQLFFQECFKAGIHVFVVETYRSQERQNWLYAQGRTRPGPIVTWTLNSRHKSRLAWDIAAATVDGNTNIYNSTIIKKAGAIANRLGITWGGNWSTPDYPHFEVTNAWKIPKGYSLNSKVVVPTRSNNKVQLSGVGNISTPPVTNPVTGMGLVDYLNSKGIDSSFNNRVTLAKKYGIVGYTGTADQNNRLLALIKNDLEKPKPNQDKPNPEKPKVKEESTMDELNSTLKAFIVGEIKNALDDGTLNSESWLDKAKRNELTAAEIAGLHMYIDRSKRMKSHSSFTMHNYMKDTVQKAMDDGILHDEKWLENLSSGALSIADAVLLTNYVNGKTKDLEK